MSALNMISLNNIKVLVIKAPYVFNRIQNTTSSLPHLNGECVLMVYVQNQARYPEPSRDSIVPDVGPGLVQLFH